MVIDPAFWRGRKVFLTGHTGFKGAWMSLWLQRLGADVTGFALAAPTRPNLFEVARIRDGMHSTTGDVRELTRLQEVLKQSRPEIVVHMAAQSLVRASYQNPAITYATNVMGTVNVLEAARHQDSVRVVLNVTSDKCYENREWPWAYREDEPMGGADPYSSSKGCSELVTAAYRRSFFSQGDSPAAVATARAGNVIGGGDWAADRLVPDFFRALAAGKALTIRNPDAIRPWQLVLEPLCGYLMLVQSLWSKPRDFARAWNFGPSSEDEWPVRRLVDRLAHLWSDDVSWTVDPGGNPHEAHDLRLDSSRARAYLSWRPRMSLETALATIVEWFRGYLGGADMHALSHSQINAYERLLSQ
jgi:CDP-glucose 4,6-dehydratase